MDVIGPQKGSHLEEVGGAKALLGQDPFQRNLVAAETGKFVRDRNVFCRTILHRSGNMVLQPATDARQVCDNREGQATQVVCVADPRKQQDLR